MISSLYTLMIVESSKTARRIQQLVPSHIFVIGTDGFIWKPVYDEKKKTLGKRADPDKLNLRKEIKQQAALASEIIISTDNDPAGDFIAWSLAKYLPGKPLKRSFLQTISKTGVQRLLQNKVEINENKLLHKLENRFLIQQYWKKYIPRHSMKEAGAIALTSHQAFTAFRSKNGTLFKTNQPLACSPDKWLTLRISPDKTEYVIAPPLSTFDVVPEIYRELRLSTYAEAQELLNQLFHKTYPDSHEGLISYPRTAAGGYYQDSWQQLQDQWVHFKPLGSFKPNFMQSILKNDEAHESIHPYDIRVTPHMVSKRVQKPFSQIYKIIYDETIRAISQPKKARSVYSLGKQLFYTNQRITESTTEVLPVYTIPKWGQQLCETGVLRPSGFGAWVDESVVKGLITINDGYISPKNLSNTDKQTSKRYKNLLESLRAVSDQPELSDETLREIFAS